MDEDKRPRPPSSGLNFCHQDDTQSSRSGDTPITPSQSITNSSQIADNNSETDCGLGAIQNLYTNFNL
ncbi:hypothetical protein KUTeg_013270 [Tegillarca granosa]|uniref:Uncharacterized protein n=1 Tax=Tegillarca granosa TaxID=220873 RepID=A0ABQ9EWP7_TEGGR|nr:hypothetical protein KUTeg_013270 [Tegillarca granosa]